jgi:hypothetical protein
VLIAAEIPLTEFSESLWRAAVESITVYSRTDAVVRFSGGTEIRVGREMVKTKTK